MDRSKIELEDLGRELRYTQQVVAQELASWQENRVETGRAALRELARKMVVVERGRLESMKRAVRELGIGVEKGGVGHGEQVNGFVVNGLGDGHGALGVVEPVSTVEQGRFHDVTDEDIEEGPGAVEDPEVEGMVLSNGEAAAEDAPPGDELAQELTAATNGVEGK
jgi:hypothetical protein